MTSEEAVKMLEYIRYTGNGESEYKNDAQSIAIDMAIKALEYTKNEESAYWYKKGIYPGWVYCSNCGEPWSFNTGAPPYCPCCGKKMRKEKE